jgi:hypothetical protein
MTVLRRKEINATQPKIVQLHKFRVSLWAPFASAIFEMANQFLFLDVHRDHRLSSASKALRLLVNVRKLRIPIRI